MVSGASCFSLEACVYPVGTIINPEFLCLGFHLMIKKELLSTS